MIRVRWIVAVIFFPVVALWSWNEQLSSYLRFDLFEIHISYFRVLAAIISIAMSIHLIRTYCGPLYSGLLLPTNLFLFLFGVMILPGLLLTSDFSVAGRISFYGYLLATLAFAFGAAGASCAARFWPKEELAKFESISLP